MSSIKPPPSLVEATLWLENSTTLDAPVRAIEPAIRAIFGTGTRSAVLRGDWLGHSLHPLLTDVVIGSWTSATVLDLIGGREASGAAQRLIGVGLLAAPPTAWSGWAEWTGAAQREKRVGLVHAVTNGLAIGIYLRSWLARRHGRHGAGISLALTGAAVAGVGGYLGGHLAAARKVGSHDSAYDEGSLDT